MREIVVFRGADGWWHAEMVGDEGTFALFGTTVLPTPYGVAIPGPAVVTLLRAVPANAGASIDWFPSREAWESDVRAMARLFGSLRRSAEMAGVQL